MKNGVEVRYFAAARAAAGAESATCEPSTLRSILESECISNPALAHVVSQCSFLVDSVAVHDHDIFIENGSVIDVLPRFAGG
ncbi:MAG: hypothetical protein F2893_00045 [Actinobacteria bacterium]|uniref:Unannotated protein n=1 Tax=freshwater metagenome TaxID=449393 RepID=A0A6J7NVN0_9ZZZZ|nr:hypothetical protein [Actinomycetota bacterium]MSY48688.1 hypothetical protein [Actinomycetota bacterium]MTH92404.1 hypothetical protein [Actinomycetota bacterium]